MVKEREIWVNARGATVITGFCETTYPYFNVRRFRIRPNGHVDPAHPAFTQLYSELTSLGYDPEIDSRGWITVDLPYHDTYGFILKKIGWAYYIALQDPQYAPPTQTQLTREAR